MIMIYRKIGIKVIASFGILLITFCGFGCAGSYIEYTSLDNDFIGKVIHFKDTMVYLFFKDKKTADEYGFIYPAYSNNIIKCELVSEYDANETKDYLTKLQVKSINKQMSFTIVGSYWQRGGWFAREFAPDIFNIILRDENDVLSVYMIADNDVKGSLKLDTDFGDN